MLVLEMLVHLEGQDRLTAFKIGNFANVSLTVELRHVAFRFRTTPKIDWCILVRKILYTLYIGSFNNSLHLLLKVRNISSFSFVS